MSTRKTCLGAEMTRIMFLKKCLTRPLEPKSVNTPIANEVNNYFSLKVASEYRIYYKHMTYRCDSGGQIA